MLDSPPITALSCWGMDSTRPLKLCSGFWYMESVADLLCLKLQDGASVDWTDTSGAQLDWFCRILKPSQHLKLVLFLKPESECIISLKEATAIMTYHFHEHESSDVATFCSPALKLTCPLSDLLAEDMGQHEHPDENWETNCSGPSVLVLHTIALPLKQTTPASHRLSPQTCWPLSKLILALFSDSNCSFSLPAECVQLTARWHCLADHRISKKKKKKKKSVLVAK